MAIFSLETTVKIYERHLANLASEHMDLLYGELDPEAAQVLVEAVYDVENHIDWLKREQDEEFLQYLRSSDEEDAPEWAKTVTCGVCSGSGEYLILVYGMVECPGCNGYGYTVEEADEPVEPNWIVRLSDEVQADPDWDYLRLEGIDADEQILNL
jgi:hypothetical protein